MNRLNTNKSYYIIDGKIYDIPEKTVLFRQYILKTIIATFFACLIAFGIAYLAFKTITQGDNNGYTTTSTNEEHNQSLREQN